MRQTLPIQPTLTLSYLTCGSGTPVILLHGLADHGLVWASLAEVLSDRYHCIAPDLRGHGESSKPPESGYSSHTIAADLALLAQSLDLEAVQVVAHSWSAKIALVWAQQQPERIRKLVLVDPFFVNRLPALFRLSLPLLYRTLPFLKAMGPFASYDSAVQTAQSLKQYRGWSSLQAATFEAGMEQKANGTWGSKFALSARNGVFLDILRTGALTDTLETSTELILPDQGLNQTALQLRPYKKYLPHLTIKSVPGNHWPHLVEPQAFNQAVSDSLNTYSGK